MSPNNNSWRHAVRRKATIDVSQLIDEQRQMLDEFVEKTWAGERAGIAALQHKD